MMRAALKSTARRFQDAPVPDESLQLRIHGDAPLPALIYLPGIHGDWTLIGSLRARLAGRVRFVEFTYPRTLTWSLDDYAAAITKLLLENGLMRGTVLAESFGSRGRCSRAGRMAVASRRSG
jgi:hypothetical protein